MATASCYVPGPQGTFGPGTDGGLRPLVLVHTATSSYFSTSDAFQSCLLRLREQMQQSVARLTKRHTRRHRDYDIIHVEPLTCTRVPPRACKLAFPATNHNQIFFTTEVSHPTKLNLKWCPSNHSRLAQTPQPSLILSLSLFHCQHTLHPTKDLFCCVLVSA